ncbi:hypothetical protein Bca4012_064462 [Brassica carinata]
MEEEAIATTTYWWCHMCSRTVDPLMEAEIKCPFCASGFVEEMAEEEEEEQDSPNTSLWAPILMQLITDPALRTTSNQTSVEDNQNHEEAETENEAGNDVDSQLREILRRRGRRGSVSVVRLSLHGVAGSRLEEPDESNGDGGGDRERGRVIMVDGGSLSEYFFGPGFEALLQRLAENDPNRYGTPPARKEAVESLATVKIQEEDTLQCSVCLDDFVIGMVAKEMPCNHKFHVDCLLPWLQLHCSCPVCRYELPSDETKTEDSARTEEPHGNDGVGSESSSSSTSSQGSENSHPEQEEEEEEEESDPVAV